MATDTRLAFLGVWFTAFGIAIALPNVAFIVISLRLPAKPKAESHSARMVCVAALMFLAGVISWYMFGIPEILDIGSQQQVPVWQCNLRGIVGSVGAVMGSFFKLSMTVEKLIAVKHPLYFFTQSNKVTKKLRQVTWAAVSAYTLYSIISIFLSPIRNDLVNPMCHSRDISTGFETAVLGGIVVLAFLATSASAMVLSRNLKKLANQKTTGFGNNASKRSYLRQSKTTVLDAKYTFYSCAVPMTLLMGTLMIQIVMKQRQLYTENAHFILSNIFAVIAGTLYFQFLATPISQLRNNKAIQLWLSKNKVIPEPIGSIMMKTHTQTEL